MELYGREKILTSLVHGAVKMDEVLHFYDYQELREFIPAMISAGILRKRSIVYATPCMYLKLENVSGRLIQYANSDGEYTKLPCTENVCTISIPYSHRIVSIFPLL